MFEKVLKDSTFRKVLIIFVIEKILILAVGFMAFYLVPADISYKDNVTDNIFLNPWAQIDSQSYLDIAKNGYNAQFGLAGNYGWYPFYPFLIRIFSFIGVELAAFMISNIASFLAVVVVYLIIKEEFGNRIAGRSVFYILFFPSAYFLTAMYTEPLFLLLASSMFYFARKENWVYVGLLGFLISMTRMQGILMFFPMLYLFYIKHKFSPKILLLLLIPLGLFSFMLYQHAITGDMFI
jgi:Gpi18-like mannosyltransferase